jgi:hypothetical protein
MKFETMKLNSTLTEKIFLGALAATFVLGLLSLSACGVEVRDKNAEAARTSNELVVDGEYIVPTPKIQAPQRTLHYDRLVLREGAKLVTNGLNLRIEIGELDSKNGIITTFPDNKVTPIGVDGRSGGNLEIVIGHATGQLQLLMRGEDGGRGIEGAAPTEALTGAKGPEGVHGEFAYPNLARSPSPGKPGAAGLTGFAGGTGFKGGDSGTATLTASAVSDFSLVINTLAGSAGRGGAGGAGGRGGPGGDPGAPQLPAGPEGPQGPQGPEGAIGASGIKQKVCVVVPGKDPWCGFSLTPGEPNSTFNLF